jgi:oligoribonuclease (3'-5' exoribonuclease)
MVKKHSIFFDKNFRKSNNASKEALASIQGFLNEVNGVLLGNSLTENPGNFLSEMPENEKQILLTAVKVSARAETVVSYKSYAAVHVYTCFFEKEGRESFFGIGATFDANSGRKCNFESHY